MRAQLLLALCLSPLAGCLAPPAVLPPFPGSVLGPRAVLERLPPGTQTVALEVEPGVVLRGVFVPAGEGAPVVLHLLESSATVASQPTPKDAVLWDLAELGFASLMVDYRGMGHSDGERSSAHLAGDAAAMWREARARAGGDSERVVVRATSLGTIAAALLLEGGARPGAAIWVVPVHARTVASRFATDLFGWPAGLLAGLIYRPVAPVDLRRAVERSGVPSLLVSSERDQLIAADHVRRLGAVVEQAGGTVVLRAGDHMILTLLAQSLLPEELGFLVERFPGWPPAQPRIERVLAALPPEVLGRFPPGSAEHARLEQLARLCALARPRDVAAAALAARDAREGFRLLALDRGRWLAGLAFDDAVAALDLEDPAGRLALELIELGARYFRLVERFGVRFDTRAPLLRMAERLRQLTPEDPILTFRATSGRSWVSYAANLDAYAPDPRGERLALPDARRRMARTLLKAMSVPERLRRGADGAWVLEVRPRGSAWMQLEL